MKQWARPLDDIMREAAGEYQPTERTPDMAKATTENQETTGGRTLVRNPEAVAMDKIATILEPLKPEARRRVLAWVNEAYYTPPQTGMGWSDKPQTTAPEE